MTGGDDRKNELKLSLLDNVDFSDNTSNGSMSQQDGDSSQQARRRSNLMSTKTLIHEK